MAIIQCNPGNSEKNTMPESSILGSQAEQPLITGDTVTIGRLGLALENFKTETGRYVADFKVAFNQTHLDYFTEKLNAYVSETYGVETKLSNQDVIDMIYLNLDPTSPNDGEGSVTAIYLMNQYKNNFQSLYTDIDENTGSPKALEKIQRKRATSLNLKRINDESRFWLGTASTIGSIGTGILSISLFASGAIFSGVGFAAASVALAHGVYRCLTADQAFAKKIKRLNKENYAEDMAKSITYANQENDRQHKKMTEAFKEFADLHLVHDTSTEAKRPVRFYKAPNNMSF